MKIVAWNVGHRAREKAIPADLDQVLAGLDADVILLNEFVDGPTREPFRAALREHGYFFQLASIAPTLPTNHVFCASRRSFWLGDAEPPPMDAYSVSNFLHVRFDHSPIELVGLRAPAYKKAAERQEYWAQLTAVMEQVSDRPIAFCGDLNRNPFVEARTPEEPSVRFPIDAYRVPNPAGEWSYVNHDGTARARIDHSMHTDGVLVTEPTYVTEFDGRALAGPLSAHPISDHAALVLTVVPA